MVIGAWGRGVVDAEVGSPRNGNRLSNDFPAIAKIEMTRPPSHRAGQPEFAWRIEKQQNLLSNAITFAGLPQASPFVNGERLASADAEHSALHLERNAHDRSAQLASRSNAFNRFDRASKDVTGTLREFRHIRRDRIGDRRRPHSEGGERKDQSTERSSPDRKGHRDLTDKLRPASDGNGSILNNGRRNCGAHGHASEVRINISTKDRVVQRFASFVPSEEADIRRRMIWA
jgi:hypothetical protein